MFHVSSLTPCIIFASQIYSSKGCLSMMYNNDLLLSFCHCMDEKKQKTRKQCLRPSKTHYNHNSMASLNQIDIWVLILRKFFLNFEMLFKSLVLLYNPLFQHYVIMALTILLRKFQSNPYRWNWCFYHWIHFTLPKFMSPLDESILMFAICVSINKYF